jgi:hypothetical protein
VNFTPRPLYPQRKSPWYPLDRTLGGPQSRSGRGGEEKNSQPLPGLEPPIIQRYTTELSWLTLSISCLKIPLVLCCEKLVIPVYDNIGEKDRMIRQSTALPLLILHVYRETTKQNICGISIAATGSRSLVTVTFNGCFT